MKRLDAVLAGSGAGTRRQVKALILQGRVALNGTVVRACGAGVGPADAVTVDGVPVRRPGPVCLMLNKPKGYVCSNEGADSVMRLVPQDYAVRRLFCVGRLDKDTSGLLLITDDGQLCHSIISPSHKVCKTYRAVLRDPASPEYAQLFKAGLTLRDGLHTRPADIEFTPDPHTVLVRLDEGKYHQVRRMFAACGNHVLDLRRLSVGPLSVEGLPEGQARELSRQELEALRAAVGLKSEIQTV